MHFFKRKRRDPAITDAKVYYSTPFGDTRDGGQKLFLLERKGVKFLPVFHSVESMKEFYERMDRAAFMVLEGSIKSVTEMNRSIEQMKAVGIVVEPLSENPVEIMPGPKPPVILAPQYATAFVAPLGHLALLRSGDAALTRHATTAGRLPTVVVEWDRRRNRYERPDTPHGRWILHKSTRARRRDELLPTGDKPREESEPATVSAMAGFVLTDEFRHALDLLAGGRHLFLTGKAGTGKSTLIRRFMADTDRDVVVVAPTGIAALNVGGYTIHRLFGFRTTTTLEDIRSGDYRPGRFTKTLASLQTLIIDEASMVRADVFDMVAAALERFGRVPGTPFGGVQIVLVGDLYQLPPVVSEHEAAFFTTTYDTPYFFSARSFHRDDFPTVSLTTVFRQLGDDRMTALLNEIREGVLVGHAQQELNARADADFVPRDDELWLTLAPTNRLVTARNRQQLERLPGDEMAHQAHASGDLSLFEPPVEETLRFKVGAQVMMLNNDQSDRWVNGSIGRVAGVGYDRHGAVVDVEFPDGSVAEVSPYTWEATRPVVSGSSLGREVIGSYTQLPFKLAWAITIHKSQGQTLDRVIVDLTGGMFSTGQLYVALSRCTSLAGLVLKRPVLPKDLKTDRRIARFLRTAADGSGARRYCAIGMLTVGDEGRMSRPRPVELAVAFDDGTAVSTLINPQRDLADARTAFGITVSDVLLAPTLREAWAVIAPMLAGCTPVGVGVDEQLGLIDFELKRLGFVTAMPLGVELGRARISGSTALERARSALEVHRAAPAEQGSSPFEEPDAVETSGLLVSRDPEAPTPVADHLPGLSALLRVSRDVAAVLLGRSVPRSIDADSAVRQSVADQLHAAATRAQLPKEVAARLEEASRLLGVEIDTAGLCAGGDGLAATLVPGMRICFTGTAQDESGRIVERPEMERLAAEAGLTPVKTVSKTRCDVLVTAEVGTQSGKARKALEYGKPVFCAEDFFAWLARLTP